MLTKKELDGMVDGQMVETLCYMKAYDVRTAKSGSKYLDGTVEIKGTVGFKVWGGVTFDEMSQCDYSGMVCKIVGKVNEFNGTKSLIISTIQALREGEYDVSEFFESRYDVDAYWDAFSKVLSKNCSEEAVNLMSEILGSVEDRFKVEFAARGHHDAFKTGLLAHTYKVCFIMSRVVKLYPSIVKVCSMDLLMMGCALHDIGKVYEYTNGSIVGNGLIVSHHTFGVEMLHDFKEKIIEAKGVEFYYSLLAIVEQHHGEWGESPRIIESYLVHLVDNLESKFQSVEEVISDGRILVNTGEFKLN